jgi:hypothetical protein
MKFSTGKIVLTSRIANQIKVKETNHEASGRSLIEELDVAVGNLTMES